MLPSNMVLLMGNRFDFNNKILVSEHGCKIGVNKSVNSTASKTVPKEAFKTARKEVFKRAPKTLSYEERVLSQKHSDKMMTISILLIGTSLVFLYFLK